MSPSPREYIQHILDEIDFVLSECRDLDYDGFIRNAALKRAFVRSLEIMGEATKKVSPEIRAQNPTIEWRKLAGMRDRLIHDYFGVDYTIVWDVAVNKLPPLKDQLKDILKELDSER